MASKRVDVDNEMLKALTLQTATASGRPGISLNAQKLFLMNNIDRLSLEHRRSIGGAVPHDKLRECAEGTVINLDTLPGQTVTAMYNLMVYHLKE